MQPIACLQQHSESKQCLINHPDCKWCAKLLDGICKGVDIGYTGVMKSIILDNWKLALVHSEVVTDYLTLEVALGRKPCPFDQPCFQKSVGMPMGIVIKSAHYETCIALSTTCYGLPKEFINDDIFFRLFTATTPCLIPQSASA